MGIDRKDVRMVCHFNIPKSMEAFYQESGRAGRDQFPSRSLLYYGIDDRKKMEFILSKTESKKSQSFGSQEGSSKKSISDFKLMVEYCEGSGCRRKNILESFGEQVPASLCRKTCDACKHPSLVAKYLEGLTCCVRQKNHFSRIFISSQDMIDEGHVSEFWNRDDEASGSEEDISDSDDGIEAVKSIAKSKMPKKSGLNEKIEFLQRAEESYYQNESSDKRVNKLNKNAVSASLREASKQRLLNALRQAHQRLGNLSIEFETSAAILENECYKKYGKTGKSFYYSQVASTVRWLSTTNLNELTNQLSGNTSSHSDNILFKEEPCATPSPSLDQPLLEITCGEFDGSSRSETSVGDFPRESGSNNTKLPVIPSFSEFVNRGRARDSQLNTSQNQSPEKNLEKRMRLQ